MDALVDWLQFTFLPSLDADDITPEQIITDVLLMEFSAFEICRGMYGYRDGYRCNNISVYYNGTADMGFHVQITGKGCRHIEGVEGFSWDKLFGFIIVYNCKVSRIDIAIDDTTCLALQRIKWYIDQKKFVTRFSRVGYVNDRNIKTGELLGETIYLGRKISDFFIRIYNKELESDGQIPGVRFEVVMRNERATMFVHEYMKPENFGSLGFLIRKVINNYIRFVKKVDSRSCRSENAEWWDEFIITAEKCKLSKGRGEITLETVSNWFERSIAASIKLLMETKGEHYVRRVVDKAILSDKHKLLKADYILRMVKEE